MNTHTTKEQEISWSVWMDLLSTSDIDEIARETGFCDENNIVHLDKGSNFEALCDFRRSQKLFNNYVKI